MRDRDVLLKLFFVRTQLSRMHGRGEITSAEFETASAAIYREERRLMAGVQVGVDSSEVNRLFLDGLNELKSTSVISDRRKKSAILSVCFLSVIPSPWRGSTTTALGIAICSARAWDMIDVLH